MPRSDSSICIDGLLGNGKPAARIDKTGFWVPVADAAARSTSTWVVLSDDNALKVY